MISRRFFLTGMSTLPLAARAQPARATRRLGWFEPTTPATTPARTAAFFEALSKGGFDEGRNLIVDYRYGYGKPETYPQIAKEIVGRSPECILATGVDTIRALVQATATIPIIMGTIDADPIKEGFAENLARPGKNVTGFSGIAWELAGKRLQLFREIVPKLKRVAIVTDLRSPAAQAHLRETESAARQLGILMTVHEIVGADSVSQLFRMLRGSPPDGLFVIAVGATNTYRDLVIRHSILARLPAFCSNTEYAENGGLVAYSSNLVDQFRRAADYVSRILKGEKAANLPIEQPRAFELVVNLRTAAEIGLVIPQSILSRADRVIPK